MLQSDILIVLSTNLDREVSSPISCAAIFHLPEVIFFFFFLNRLFHTWHLYNIVDLGLVCE